MQIRATSQPDVFQDAQTGAYFPHDGQHPLSVALAAALAAGTAQIEPYTPPTYASQRLAAYGAELNGQELQEAIFEKFGEGRPEKFDALQARRLEIKARFPKVAAKP
jgi:hypothetical protein